MEDRSFWLRYLHNIKSTSYPSMLYHGKKFFNGSWNFMLQHISDHWWVLEDLKMIAPVLGVLVSDYDINQC